MRLQNLSERTNVSLNDPAIVYGGSEERGVRGTDRQWGAICRSGFNFDEHPLLFVCKNFTLSFEHVSAVYYTSNVPVTSKWLINMIVI